MKSDDIQKGDQFLQEGRLRYTVIDDIEIDGDDVIVPIRWDPSQGGGRDRRTFGRGQTVPLVRPERPLSNLFDTTDPDNPVRM
jgi:hypothetical protein